MNEFFKKPKNIVLTSVAAVLLILVLFGTFVLFDIFGVIGDSTDVEIEIKEGYTVTNVADALEAYGIIDSSLYFKAYVKLFASDFVVEYGRCSLNSSMSYGEIIDVLAGVSTHAEGITLVIPEGYNIFDVAKEVEEQGICSAQEFINECRNGDFSEFWFIAEAEKNQYRYTLVEGYLFPDTYEFPMDCTAHSVIEGMLENFQLKYGDDLQAKADALGMSTDEVIILASVVQCEVGSIHAEERTVSSVFHNRLNSSYTFLESDPTIFYGNELKEWDPSVTMEMQKAYSTYVSAGVPAGAICNPGMSSIEATLDPADTDYYFFVTDPNSVFYYAETYNEHLNNVAYTKTVEKN